MTVLKTRKQSSPAQSRELLGALQARFQKNMNRHERIEWTNVSAKLEATPEKLWSLGEMERTGGEPDAVGLDKKTGEYVFLIVHRKALKTVEAFATTGKRWIHGK